MTVRPAPPTFLDRVASILDALEGSGRLTLSELTELTGIPRSTAHRILERLVRMRWLKRDGNDYELGARIMEIGSVALEQNRWCAAARPILHRLYLDTGYVVHFGMLDGPDVFYLDKVGGKLAIQVPTRPGGRSPARLSAIGKVLIAHGRIDRIGRSMSLTEAIEIRQSGVAHHSCPVGGGINVIAAPIKLRGRPCAGVSISGPSTHVKFTESCSAPVRRAAEDISRAMWRQSDAEVATAVSGGK